MPRNGGQQPPDKDDAKPSGGPGQGASERPDRSPPERPERPDRSQPKRPERPEYTVYRSRPGLLSRFRTPHVSSLRERARRSYRRLGRGGPKAEDQGPT